MLGMVASDDLAMVWPVDDASPESTSRFNVVTHTTRLGAASQFTESAFLASSFHQSDSFSKPFFPCPRPGSAREALGPSKPARPICHDARKFLAVELARRMGDGWEERKPTHGPLRQGEGSRLSGDGLAEPPATVVDIVSNAGGVEGTRDSDGDGWQLFTHGSHPRRRRGSRCRRIG